MKRTIMIAVVMMLALSMAISGTIAYLSDTDSDVNVMTLGNVKIDQTEWNDAEATDPFTQDKPLYPAYYADGAQAADDITGEVTKYVKVENTGASEAYVRTVFAFEGDKIGDIVHVVANETDWTWDWNNTEIVEINGVTYTVVVATYPTALAAKDETPFSLEYIYMDKKATNDDVAVYGDAYEVLVQTQAVQTANLEVLGSAEAALNEAFGTAEEKAAEWFGDVTPVQSVANADDLAAALAVGGTVRLANDIKLNDVALAIGKNQHVTIDLAGHALVGQSTSNSTSNLIKVNAGATLTLKNGTVSFAATQPDVNWGGDGQPAFPGYANNTISCSGTLIIDGATIENKTAPGGASYAIDCYPGADVIIESGRVDGCGKVAIRMFANSKNVPTNVTINGGAVVGSRAVWIQLPGSDTATIPPVNLTVNGGTLSSTDSEYYLAIYSYSYGNNFNNTKVNLNGGTYYGHVAFSGGKKNGTEKVTVNKENCTFYGDVFSYNENVADYAQAADEFVADVTELKEALEAGETNLVLGPGTYSFPHDSITDENVVITCAEGTVFEDGSKLNIKGATVVGATFSNPATYNTVNGIYKDCTFTGANGLRYGYAGETVVFENCVFSGSTYGAHFDSGANDVLFKNCTFSGFNAMGSAITKLTMEGCTFKANGKSGYNGINLWGSTDMKDCTFIFDGTATEWVDACGDNKTLTFTGCVISDGTTERALTAADVGDYGTGNTITVK